MWEAHNHTPFAIDKTFLRDLDGAEVWIMAARATFNIGKNGQLIRAEEQEPVRMVAEYTGEPGESPLRYDTDMVLRKPGTDFILHGHAYAPGRKEVRSLPVSVRVGNWSKSMLVHGERVWQNGAFKIKPSEARPFGTMPLDYQRAWGGHDTAADPNNGPVTSQYNPIGKGFAQNPKTLDGQLVPNLEYKNQPVVAGPTLALPAGFGPIAPHWEQRHRFCGTYDEAWQQERMPLLPEDFDLRFNRCAPPDQQFDNFLQGGEAIELHNLTPEGKLQFQIPRITLHTRTIFDDGKEEVEAKLHTIIIESDHPRIQLVWHAALRCQGREQALLRAFIRFKGERTWQ